MRPTRKYVVSAVVVVAVGVIASVFVLPNKADLARQQAKDVQTVDLGNVDLDTEYAQGRRTFPIISALADKRITAGDRPGAIKLWEEYTKANTAEPQGHKKLAEQYQLAGRQAEYNNELVALAAADPTEANLRVLSDIYNGNKEYAKQAEVLKKILDVTKGENPQVYIDLATIQLVVNDKDGALKTLESLKDKHPDFSSYPATRIMVSVLAEKGEVDRAFTIAQAWANKPSSTAQDDPRPKELADLCNIFHYSGHADKAVALIDPHLELLPRSPELVVAYVNADVTLGRADHAYSILRKIDEAKRMVPALWPIYLELTLKREDLTTAQAIAAKLDVNAFNEEQALNIIELARANNAPSVVGTLLTRFGSAKVLEGKPVLAAVIAILEKDKRQDQKIETALNTKLSSIQRTRLAEACARAQKTACFDAIVKQFPPINAMSPAQVAEYAQLYLIADRSDQILKPVGAKAAEPNAHVGVVHAYHRLAAASGRLDLLKPWLEANANSAPLSMLQELFYIANDHHHSAVASDIAQRLYARDPSPINRGILTNALVGAGEYEKALPLIREQMKQPGANDGLYLTTLSKLARKNPTYRKELADYAEAALKSGRGDSREQLNYAYVLINQGRKDIALPYAKKYATTRGGDWKNMLAQLTMVPGKAGKNPVNALSREQRIAMANTPGISETNRREIAFSLLNDGHKADAAVIFQSLAANKGPDSQEVKDLLYIWGGKLGDAELKWVEARAAAASPYDKLRWAELINHTADDAAIMRYVNATPDALYAPALRKKYFDILATRGTRQNFDLAMRDWVAQTTDTSALNDYASIAKAHGYSDAAAIAYNRVLAIDPNNKKALNEMAALQFSKGKFSAADRNLSQYLANPTPAPGDDSDAIQAHFYKGELLHRAGNHAAASAEYTQVIALTQAAITRTPSMYSRLYTAQFRLGQHDAAKAGFNALLAQNPDDKSILADYMSALIEYHYLTEATRVANQYDKTSPSYGKGSALMGQSAHIASVEPLSNGRELKITFNQPLEGTTPLTAQNAQKTAWLEETTTGYDTVTISAKPGYVVRFIPTQQQQFIVAPAAAPIAQPDPAAEAKRQQDLRLQLLYAHIEQDSGQPDLAAKRVAILKQYYPNDPMLISYEAALASANGNRSTAMNLLRQAQTLSPDNEDITLAMQNLERAPTGGATRAPSYAKLDQAYRGIGKNDEYITTVSGGVGVTNQVELGANVQNDALTTKATRRSSNGIVGDYNVSRQRGEAYAAYRFEDADRVQVSAFANNDTPGAGAYYGFSSPVGRVELLGEYHRPYWDFVEAVTSNATRDRVGLTDYVNLTPTTSMGIETSYNEYNTDEVSNARETILARLSLVQQLQAQSATQPYLGIGYGFDGEYRTGSTAKVSISTLGEHYNSFALGDREFHSLTGIYQDDWTKTLHARLVGGVAYDRFSSTFSPLVDARLDQDIDKHWQVGARGRYALDSSNSDNHELDLGADLVYKF